MQQPTSLLVLFCTMLCLSMQTQATDYSIKVVTGTELQTVRDFFVQQRIAVFREYPYLYRGSYDEGYAYFDWFSRLPQSAAAVAYEDQTVVGFLAGTDFTDFDEHFAGSIELFNSAGLHAQLYYYLSEAIIAPEHRGNRIFIQLASALAQHAAMLGYQKLCFVHEEHATHPLKPDNYKDLPPLFLRFGCRPTSLVMRFSWNTIQPDGTAEAQEHTMNYWIKDL